MPTVVKTKPDATLFCRKDVLPATLEAGEAVVDGSTTTVVCVTGSGVNHIELICVKEMVVLVDDVEEMAEEETTLVELSLSYDIDDDEIELDALQANFKLPLKRIRETKLIRDTT